jgi:hypothetical protein
MTDNVTRLIEARQERFAKDVASLIKAGNIDEAMQRVKELSERVDRRASEKSK